MPIVRFEPNQRIVVNRKIEDVYARVQSEQERLMGILTQSSSLSKTAANFKQILEKRKVEYTNTCIVPIGGGGFFPQYGMIGTIIGYETWRPTTDAPGSVLARVRFGEINIVLLDDSLLDPYEPASS